MEKGFKHKRWYISCGGPCGPSFSSILQMVLFWSGGIFSECRLGKSACSESI